MTEVKVRIDLTSTEQRKALNDLFDVIAATTRPIYEKRSTEVEPTKKVKDVPKKPEAVSDSKPSSKKSDVKQTGKTEAQKTTPKGGGKDSKANVETETEPTKTKPTLGINDVREVVAKKAAAHRTEMKAKLKQLGADNVTKLDPAKYGEFLTFLNSL